MIKPVKNQRTYKYILLFFLYLSQGLPFGFQATALPVYLRTNNVTLTIIGFTGALAAPWMLKALLAPFVDRFGCQRIGRRKSWIIPLQLLMITSIVFASVIQPGENLKLLLIAVFFMNLFAAAQDVAVDGLAVDILGTKELGIGNVTQVAGYKTGMMLSGGLLVWLSPLTGWQGLFFLMAVVSLPALALILFYREDICTYIADTQYITLRMIMKDILTVFFNKNTAWIILFIATYKLGESMIDFMFKPFLIDSGFHASDIGLWVGSYGMAASIAGSVIGGLLCSWYSVFWGVAVSAVLRVFPLIMEWWFTVSIPDASGVIAVTMAEHFFGGMLTTSMFAFMMSLVDRRIGATHYTLLATIEVLGKSPGALLSGFFADISGYQTVFLAGVILTLLNLILLFKIHNHKKIFYTAMT